MQNQNDDSKSGGGRGGYDSLDDEMAHPLELGSEERIRRQIELEETQNASDPDRKEHMAEERAARRKRVAEMNPADLWGLVQALLDGLGESTSHVGAAKGYLRQVREVIRVTDDRVKALEEDHDEIQAEVRMLPKSLSSSVRAEMVIFAAESEKVREALYQTNTRLGALERNCAEARGAFPRGPVPLVVFRKLVETVHDYPRASLVVALGMAATAAAIIWGGEDVGRLVKFLLGAG